MKILYRQNDNNGMALKALGIDHCYLKRLEVDSDRGRITNKAHHHNGFEIHIIEKGYQVYLVGEREYKVFENEFLLIPCGIIHRVVESAPKTVKYSITFSANSESCANSVNGCACGTVDEKIKSAVARVLEENARRSLGAELLVAGAVFELAVRLLRAGRMVEAVAETAEEQDPRLAMAKQYIIDNAEQKLSVSEVAAYCALSEKQLTRLFDAEGTTPADFIRTQKIRLIEQMLSEGKASLKEISEKMNFSNEFYFNTFFKKYSGMTPGEYRKMSLSR